MSETRKSKIVNIAFVGVLLAMEIVLSRFLSISMWNMKIGFAFIPIVIAARRFGMPQAMIVSGLGDFLGAILFPIGPYFPGFTFTAILKAAITALFIHKKVSFARIAVSTVINQIIGSILLNTLWVSILYGSAFLPLMITRLTQAGIMTVVEIVVMWVLLTKGDSVICKRFA